MPTVINRHHHKALPPGSIYIGRGTPLGNPYTVEKYGRELALLHYEEYIDERLAMDERREGPIWKALAGIKQWSVLVCSCKPMPCHGDIVVRVWAREFGQEGLL